MLKNTCKGSKLALIAVLALVGCPDKDDEGDPQPCREEFETTVSQIVDGDTFDVDPPVPMPDGDQNDRVRMLCLETPETGECHADEATDALGAWIDGQTVTLTFTDTCTGYYGRALAYVWLGNQLVNVEMAREGHGGLIQPPYDDEPHCDEVEQAMQEAAADGLGGWADCSGYPFEL